MKTSISPIRRQRRRFKIKPRRRPTRRRRPQAPRLLPLAAILAVLLCVSSWYFSPALLTSAGLLLWEAKSPLVELLLTVAAVALQRRN